MELPKITDAAGVEHTMRRLGYDDLFAIAAIAGEMVSSGGLELGTRLRHLVAGGQGALEGLALSAVLGVPAVRDQFAEWAASVLGVATGDFKDPDKFPLSLQPKVAQALASHPDLVALVADLPGLLEILPAGLRGALTLED